MDALKLRYFITDHDAVRLSLGFGITKETIKDDDTVDDYVNTTKGDFSIDLGYERHFKIANRLSLYAGGEVGFLSHFASGKGKTTIAGAITTVDFKTLRLSTVIARTLHLQPEFSRVSIFMYTKVFT